MLLSILKISRNYSFKILPLILLLALFSDQVHAGEKGRVELDGREIILFDDNTWRFVGETAKSSDNDDCVVIKSKSLPVSVCLDEAVWTLGNANNAAEFTFTTKDQSLFLMVITEKTEIPLKAFEKAIITNAQNAAGLKPVEIAENERIDAFGIKWGRMVYNADIDGLIIKYENFFTTIKDKGSVQFVFYTTPANYAEASIEIEKATKNISVDQ